MPFYIILTEFNGPLEAAHAPIKDDRYDMVKLKQSFTRQLKSDLSDQLRVCRIASTHARRLSSANVILYYIDRV